MGNKPKPKPSALFPARTEYPETKKMTENFEGNAAIYDFFDHLLDGGYVLARRDPETGVLRAMRTRPTVEHEVLVFRGVDKLAYHLERDALRAAYPHIWEKYGMEEAATIHDARPEFADEAPRVRHVQVDRSRQEPVGDDVLLSLSEAWRQGVFTLTPSHSGVRVKMARCRRLYPDLVPTVIPRGSLTLYRAGDLRRWEHEYTERAADIKAGVAFVGSGDRLRDAEAEPVEAFDALEFLMSKIRGEKEDVRKED